MPSSRERATPRPRRPPATSPTRLEEIKAAAVKFFYERGYHGTDLRLIAAAIGLHPSSFYNYVKSKEEILYLILRDGIEGVNAGLDETLRGVTDPVEALRRAITFHVLWCTTKQYVSWVQILELPSLEGDFRKEIVAGRDAYEAKFRDILERGVAHGLFRVSNIQLASFGLLGMMSSVARWYNPRGPASPQTIAESIADMVIEGLRADDRQEESHPRDGAAVA